MSKQGWVNVAIALGLGVALVLVYELYAKIKGVVSAGQTVWDWISGKTVINAAVAGAQDVNQAADVASEQTGFADSSGQNDPLLLYNQARVAYAQAQDYDPGSPDWLAPPGFPDFDTWQTQNPDTGTATSDSWFTDFKKAL